MHSRQCWSRPSGATSGRSYRSYSLNFLHESDALLNEFAKGTGDLEKALELEPNNPNLGKIEGTLLELSERAN